MSREESRVRMPTRSAPRYTRRDRIPDTVEYTAPLRPTPAGVRCLLAVLDARPRTAWRSPPWLESAAAVARRTPSGSERSTRLVSGGPVPLTAAGRDTAGPQSPTFRARRDILLRRQSSRDERSEAQMEWSRAFAGARPDRDARAFSASSCDRLSSPAAANPPGWTLPDYPP